MRRTGKTTRLIDEAVQMLFNDGEITVLNNYQLFDKAEKWKRGFKDEQINARLRLIDPDARKDNKAQFYFYEALKRRLYTEHYGAFEEAGNTFKLK